MTKPLLGQARPSFPFATRFQVPFSICFQGPFFVRFLDRFSWFSFTGPEYNWSTRWFQPVPFFALLVGPGPSAWTLLKDLVPRTLKYVETPPCQGPAQFSVSTVFNFQTVF